MAGGVGLFFLVVILLIFKVDGQSVSIINGHPGLSTLLVVFLTGLVLMTGLPKAIEASMVGKVLVVLGKYSYSIYLVHFPIIVLYLSEPFAGQNLPVLNIKALVILLLLIFSSAFLLHKYVEIRKFNSSIVRFSVIACLLTILLSFCLPFIQDRMFSIKEMHLFKVSQDRSTYRCGKIFRVFHIFGRTSAISCELTGLTKNIKNKLMLVGDSHADSIKSAFAKVARKNGNSLHFIVQNNPLMIGGPSLKSIVNEVILQGISHVILHYSPSAIDYRVINQLVTQLEKVNIGVIFIDPVPVHSKHIPRMMYENIKNNGKLIIQTKQDYLVKNKKLFSELSKIEGQNFKRIVIVDYFCRPECSYKNAEGKPLYFDNGHLTKTGSDVLENVFYQIVKELE